ncbi:hypothetical protein AAG570_000148 [Ranatra chinensis]|uniref:Peroxisomal membrane protein 2 n=1 Tax=Ranatra chinensis TaxID=642074 RepID=A0ABD0YW79_9HEMI
MSYSKPVKVALLNLSASYLQALYLSPIKTKSLTSCAIASLGNYTSQKISGAKEINCDSLLAFGLFGLLFGGTVPHYFYHTLEWIVPGSNKTASLLKLFIERFIYAPFYQYFALYVLSRLEGKSHLTAKKLLQNVYFDVLRANWKWLSIVQFINLFFIPPVVKKILY